MSNAQNVFDVICGLAAKSFAADAVCIIYQSGKRAPAMLGVFGSRRLELFGDVEIPSLDPDSQPIMSFSNLGRQAWFRSHQLRRICPTARSVLTVALPTAPRSSSYIALLWNGTMVVNYDAALVFQFAALVAALVEPAEGAPLGKSSKSTEIFSQLGLSESATSVYGTAHPIGEEAILAFLTRTLIKRPTLKARNGITFVVVRHWKAQLKDAQIAAVQGLKLSQNSIGSMLAAREIVDALTSLMPIDCFAAVVPIPGGSSGMASSFSVRIAEQVAAQLKLPMKEYLSAQPVDLGNSHPQKSAKLKPYGVEGRLEGRFLLIDDIASTGTHLEKGTTALRTSGAEVFAMAWIGS